MGRVEGLGPDRRVQLLVLLVALLALACVAFVLLDRAGDAEMNGHADLAGLYRVEYTTAEAHTIHLREDGTFTYIHRTFEAQNSFARVTADTARHTEWYSRGTWRLIAEGGIALTHTHEREGWCGPHELADLLPYRLMEKPLIAGAVLHGDVLEYRSQPNADSLRLVRHVPHGAHIK